MLAKTNDCGSHDKPWQQRDRKLAELRAAGASIGTLGLRFGISKQRVHQILKAYPEANLAYHRLRAAATARRRLRMAQRGPEYERRLEEIRRLRGDPLVIELGRAGWEQKRIAKVTQLRQQTVSRILIRAGLRRYPRRFKA